MTLEELWHLFPISLVPHNSNWKSIYEDEKKTILSILSPKIVKRISHIGSTAIPDIYAKNIIDILLEVNSHADLLEAKDCLVKNGWICMNQCENRISLNKGYTPNGFAEKVFHLHIRIDGDCDEVYFRDYLCSHPDVAKEYESLKLSLWKQFEYDRDGYTNAKSEFVKRYTEMGKKQK